MKFFPNKKEKTETKKIYSSIRELEETEQTMLNNWMRLLEISFRKEINLEDISFYFHGSGIGLAISARYKNIRINLTDYNLW